MSASDKSSSQGTSRGDSQRPDEHDVVCGAVDQGRPAAPGGLGHHHSRLTRGDLHVSEAVNLVDCHSKALHELHRHVNIGLADQLVFDDDFNAFSASSQGGCHEQRCQVLAGH